MGGGATIRRFVISKSFVFCRADLLPILLRGSSGTLIFLKLLSRMLLLKGRYSEAITISEVISVSGCSVKSIELVSFGESDSIIVAFTRCFFVECTSELLPPLCAELRSVFNTRIDGCSS